LLKPKPNEVEAKSDDPVPRDIESEHVKPQSRLEGYVLVVVEGGIAEAVCAEPVIRSLVEQSDGRCFLTVCQKHADLYAGHPAVRCVIYEEDDDTCGHGFGTIVRLTAPAEAMSFQRRVEAYARQMEIVPGQACPKITLAGYDLIRAQRFGACTLKRPRIAVAVNPLLLAEQKGQWERFCESLIEHLDCSVMLLGDAKTELPASKNLSGKLTAREAAAVLSQCDILATTEENYAALALGVGIDAIVINSDAAIGDKDEFAGVVRISEFSPELILSAMRQRSNPIT
jgi:hypothetical protein